MPGHQIDAADHQSGRRRKVETEAGPDHKSPVHPLITLQSQIGNAQVARLLAQREAEEDELQMKHDLSLQREGEEDELQMKHDLSVQREGEEDELQTKHDEHVGIEGGPVGPDTAQRIQSARGAGSALDGGTRASMESAF